MGKTPNIGGTHVPSWCTQNWEFHTSLKFCHYASGISFCKSPQAL